MSRPATDPIRFSARLQAAVFLGGLLAIALGSVAVHQSRAAELSALRSTNRSLEDEISDLRMLLDDDIVDRGYSDLIERKLVELRSLLDPKRTPRHALEDLTNAMTVEVVVRTLTWEGAEFRLVGGAWSDSAARDFGRRLGETPTFTEVRLEAVGPAPESWRSPTRFEVTAKLVPTPERPNYNAIGRRDPFRGAPAPR